MRIDRSAERQVRIWRRTAIMLGAVHAVFMAEKYSADNDVLEADEELWCDAIHEASASLAHLADVTEYYMEDAEDGGDR